MDTFTITAKGPVASGKTVTLRALGKLLSRLGCNVAHDVDSHSMVVVLDEANRHKIDAFEMPEPARFDDTPGIRIEVLDTSQGPVGGGAVRRDCVLPAVPRIGEMLVFYEGASELVITVRSVFWMPNSGEAQVQVRAW